MKLEFVQMVMIMAEQLGGSSLPPHESGSVCGEIVFNPKPDPSEYGRMVVHIYLEDVSHADAAARVITSLTIDHIPQEARAKARVPFVIGSATPDSKARYSLRVHVDVDGDGKVSRGDYISKSNYPVLTRGSPGQVEVRVEVVE
jgi:hypothetical protein